MSAQSKYYNTGGGELYFTPLVDGVYGTESAFGQTENVSFSSEVETITHDNTEGSTIFEDISILKKITGKIAIESIEVSPDMLTKAFLGTKYVTSVPAGTNVTANVTVTEFDKALSIGTKYVSNVVVKDDTDATTYVEGTDYTIDYTNGTITVLSSGGTIALNDVLHLTFDNSAYDDVRIEAFLESKLEGRLRFVSKPANGMAYTYTFHKVSLLASGDYMLKSADEFSKLSFEGALLASELITEDGVSKLFKIEGSELTA
jgi:hypothetical protein